MTDGVLDLIDGAISGQADAMRWQPPEQRAADLERLRTTMAGFATALSSFAEEFAAGIKRAAEALAAIRAFDPAAAVRRRDSLRRMHTAYRRRQ